MRYNHAKKTIWYCSHCYRQIQKGEIYARYNEKLPSGSFSSNVGRMCCKCIDKRDRDLDKALKEMGYYSSDEDLGWDLG